MKAKELRILIVEDVEADAELCQRELRRARVNFRARCVDNQADFERALREFTPDLILSDFSMPGAFDGMAALDLARAHSDVPFVFVSGTIGEDRAVDAMRRGATDYVLKDRLNRLAPVIERALREGEERAARRKVESELQETRSRLDSIVSSLPDVVWSYSLRERRLLYVSPAANTIFGRPEASLYENPTLWMNMIHPEDRERVERERRQSLSKRRMDSMYRVVLPGGQVRWIHDRGAVITGDGGELLRIDGLARDVTDLKLQEQRIARLSRIRAVLSGINVAIVRIRDRQKLFEEACRIAVEHGGFEVAWIGRHDGPSVTPVAHAVLRDGDRPDHAGLMLRGEVPGSGGLIEQMVRECRPTFCNDIAQAPRTGERRAEAVRLGYRSVIVLPLTVAGAVVASVALYSSEPGFFDDEEIRLLTELADDVSFALDHIAKEERLNYLAYYDVLTGLPNRTLFQDRLAQRVNSARREGRIFSVMMLDIERFRQINETLGRQAGDGLLREVALRLGSALDVTDVLAHIGGDYFAIATREAEENRAVVRLLEHALATVAGRPFAAGGSELRLAARAGVAMYPSDGADAESLLRNAEAALKNSKQSGQRYLFYAPQMNARVAEQLRLENDLRRAVTEEQFTLYYQPRLDLARGVLSGFEALIRWPHPERGLVMPEEFIPLLEGTGLILEVGRWALSRAARDHAAWRAAGLRAPRVAVNVSAFQLRRDEFVDEVRAALAGTDGARHIDVEITESMLMEDIDGNIEKLKAIQAMGMMIAMDDFGTGYCSLSYLSRLPINSLKIDRSFIARMAQGADQMAIVSAIVSLARALNLKVVAEGVETQEQANLLRLLRCDEVQGYLFGKPVPEAVSRERLMKGGAAAPG